MVGFATAPRFRVGFRRYLTYYPVFHGNLVNSTLRKSHLPLEFIFFSIH
jgi:hypothetical protein